MPLVLRGPGGAKAAGVPAEGAVAVVHAQNPLSAKEFVKSIAECWFASPSIFLAFAVCSPICFGDALPESHVTRALLILMHYGIVECFSKRPFCKGFGISIGICKGVMFVFV